MTAQDSDGARSEDSDTGSAPEDDGCEIPVVNLSVSQPDERCDDHSDDDGSCTCPASAVIYDAACSDEPQQLQQKPVDADVPPPSREELEAERARADEYEQRLKLALADYQNLSRRTGQEVEAGTLKRTADVMTDVVTIRDDLARARDASAKDGADTSGLDSILRNMDSALARHGVTPIDALGEIFDPAMHEAVSTEVDGMLDEGTITREVRRGYALKNTIIRPSMVVISKKE